MISATWCSAPVAWGRRARSTSSRSAPPMSPATTTCMTRKRLKIWRKHCAKRLATAKRGMLPRTLTIRVALHHETRYAYDRPVELGPHVVRLRPAPHCRTPILAHTLRVAPAEHFIQLAAGPFRELSGQARILEASDGAPLRGGFGCQIMINPFDFFLEEKPRSFRSRPRPLAPRETSRPICRRCRRAPLDRFRRRPRARVVTARKNMVDVLVDLNQLVNKTLRYDIRME